MGRTFLGLLGLSSLRARQCRSSVLPRLLEKPSGYSGCSAGTWGTPRVCSQCITQAPVLEGPTLGSRLCCCHLEMLKDIRPRSLRFHSTPGWLPALQGQYAEPGENPGICRPRGPHSGPPDPLHRAACHCFSSAQPQPQSVIYSSVCSALLTECCGRRHRSPASTLCSFPPRPRVPKAAHPHSHCWPGSRDFWAAPAPLPQASEQTPQVGELSLLLASSQVPRVLPLRSGGQNRVQGPSSKQIDPKAHSVASGTLSSLAVALFPTLALQQSGLLTACM